jgi:serine protease AprX
MPKKKNPGTGEGPPPPTDAPSPPPPAPAAPAAPPSDRPDELHLNMGRAVVPPALHDAEQRKAWNLPAAEDEPGPYMVELNLRYKGGIKDAADDFKAFYAAVIGKLRGAAPPPPVLVSRTYYRCLLSVDEWRALAAEDEKRERRERLIYRIWPDFPVKALVDHSVATVKADAAVRSYAAYGDDIVWAVIDSGIEATHPHFGPADRPEEHLLLHPDVQELHRDFTAGETSAATAQAALADGFGHGTHVAGIIAGGLDKERAPDSYRAFENVVASDPSGENVERRVEERRVAHPEALRGVAPRTRLVSLKVLDANGAGRASDVMAALTYLREEVNGDPKVLRVHGVNLSIGYEFDAEMFACGQSPLCVEVDRLVKSGVVVVVAAGNTGYGRLSSLQRQTKVGLSNTINDPGNAALAITVGATHRDSPHTYGVSYFSSKGPTGDGRLKPDLVAPGERITSCAAKAALARAGLPADDGVAAYIDDTGTSMAAPHVSGAVAAFLSIRREFIQRPEDVKRIFLESATSLGRERYFEGHGLLDLMRAIQSV